MSATSPRKGLVSVIISHCGRLGQTRLCLAALAWHTRRPWEAVIIGGSGLSTAATDYARLQQTGVSVKVIAAHDANEVGSSYNQALQVAQGDWLVLLSGSTMVTDGWLDQLLALAASDPIVGMVGPMSNDASPPQRVEDVRYVDRQSLDIFAAQWRRENLGRWCKAERLAHSCLLLKRHALDQVGQFDETLPVGFCIDEFCRRLHASGFSLAIAQDLYVHHFDEAWVTAWNRVARSWDQIPGTFDVESVYNAAVEGASNGSIFVEVGCLAGRSTCYLASKIRDSRKAIRLYAIDTALGSPWDYTGQEIAPALGGSFAGVLHRNIIGCGFGDVIIPILTTSLKASRLFAEVGVDFGFINGDPSYASVTEDLNAWWPKIRSGGILAGHNYRQEASWLAGLTPAVHNFFDVTGAAHPAMPGCWAMMKGDGVAERLP